MLSKLFNTYLWILNLKKGVSFYIIILIILQITSLILVIPNLIPYFDKFLIIYINLAYLIIFVLSLKLSYLFCVYFKNKKKILKIGFSFFSIIFLFIWVFITYALTSLAIGQGVFGPKLVAEYEILGYDKTVYIYRNILLDTSIVIKEKSGIYPIMKNIKEFKNIYGYNVKAYRCNNSVEFDIDTISCLLNISTNKFKYLYKNRKNCFAFQEIYSKLEK